MNDGRAVEKVSLFDMKAPCPDRSKIEKRWRSLRAALIFGYFVGGVHTVIGAIILCLAWAPEIPPQETPRHTERALFMFLSGCVQIFVVGAIHFATRRLCAAFESEASPGSGQSP